MEARQLMTQPVECVSPEMRIAQAARRMEALDIGFLPVCENDRVIGTVTDRDIVLRAVAKGLNVLTSTVREIMTPEVCWCYEDQPISDIGDSMEAKAVRRVLIMNRAKRLSGVVSIGDLAKRGARDRVGVTMNSIADTPRQAA